MSLPAALGEQQQACLRNYGKEHCEQFHLDTRNSNVTIFAGVLRHRFATKKSAQTSFGLSFKAWVIVRGNRGARGWYRELTVEQYLAEFRDIPGEAGRRMQNLVRCILRNSYRVTACHDAKKFAAQEKAEKEKVEKE